MAEFLARVRAAARRGALEAEPLPTVQTPDFMLDFANYHATRSGEDVHLTPTEWRLLSALAATPGHLVTHAALLRAAWGPSYGRESNYLRVYANQLRRKLEPDTGRPRYIINEPGVGYRFMI
jgi:two-component system KDP operon response regulator KdpE